MKNNLEFMEISRLLKSQPRSQRQINGLFEADCEILKLSNCYLSSSTDSIGEEIDIGLYKNPELWGWMTAIASISDLAASGSTPLGLLLSNQWKYGTSKLEKLQFFTGIRKALKKSNVPLIGGDSGSGTSHCHSSTILGTSLRKPLTRLGIRVGDHICLVGKKKLGLGPALAYRFLFKHPEELLPESYFRPLPQPQLISQIRPFIHATIDTSDGLATSLQILSELNNVGFELHFNPLMASPIALAFCKVTDLHPLMLVMGDHGDYQTLISVPEKNLKKVLQKSRDIIPIGITTSNKKQKQLIYENQVFQLPTEKVTTCARDVNAIYSLSLEVNKLFKSQSSPTRLASKPADNIRPKVFGDEK